MTQGNLATLGITPERIRHYDQRIPRYTSYPTAPYWTERFGPDEWRRHIMAHANAHEDLSLYVHIPFCRKHCLFCACNVIITPKAGVASSYIDYLRREMELVARLYKSTGKTVQLHFGGGTPNYLDRSQLARIISILKGEFDFTPDAELSIEADPRVATPDDIHAYHRELGFRRISFGTQDFSEDTQRAIGRGQTRDITIANVNAAREAGFRSVNIDLIYGLPRQTEASWSATIDDICLLRPDRIALYNFAYLPGKLAHQRALAEEEFPSPELKLQMFVETHNRLTAEGYVFIGMDHYALAGDSLTQALEAGTLRRNFMGYTTLRGTNMLAFGTSSISDFHGAFAQNHKKLSVYKRMIEEGVLPTERGMILSDDDRRRRHIIEEIMCNGKLRYVDVAPDISGADIRALVEAEAPRLLPLEDDGLLEFGETELRVTTKGRIFLRNIAVLFDAYLKAPAQKPLFSRSV